MADPAIMPFSDSPRNGAWGDRPYAIIDWAGPSSYVQVVRATPNTNAVPTTGGQAITPSSFGLTAPIEGIIMVGCSTSGTYGVEAIQQTNYPTGTGNATWILEWYLTSTGAEVTAGTALNNENVRLIAFGPY